MLDLLTLGMSIGAQEELKNARKTHGATVNQPEETTCTTAPPSVLEQAANVVGTFFHRIAIDGSFNFKFILRIEL